jgi:hypothetical protein
MTQPKESLARKIKTNKQLAAIIAVSVIVGGIGTSQVTFAGDIGLYAASHGGVQHYSNGRWYYRDHWSCAYSYGRLVNCRPW